jgi:hypothetical protein
MVVAGKIGIVGQKHVAIRDVSVEGFLQGSNRKSPATSVDWNAVGLRGDGTIGVGDKTRKIVGL